MNETSATTCLKNLRLPHPFLLLHGIDVSHASPLKLNRSCVSSADSSLSDKPFLMLSNHIRFGLPLLLPGTSVNSSNELMFTILLIRRIIKLIVLYCIVLYLHHHHFVAHKLLSESSTSLPINGPQPTS